MNLPDPAAPPFARLDDLIRAALRASLAGARIRPALRQRLMARARGLAAGRRPSSPSRLVQRLSFLPQALYGPVPLEALVNLKEFHLIEIYMPLLRLMS